MPNSVLNKQVSARTLGAFMAMARQQLRDGGIDNPDLDTNLLIMHGLGLDRADLLSQSQIPLSSETLTHLNKLINERLSHKPVARILGVREFWGLPFQLNASTLVPRPDSETLIEVVLKNKTQKNYPYKILDLGTGTGCLLLALLHEYQEANGLGIDYSEEALLAARTNAEKLDLLARATFLKNNWVEGINDQFDIVISNPPYIPTPTLAQLMPEVRDYDPKLALDGGEDGLSIYRQLTPQLKALIPSGGMVVFEVGHDQAKEVANLLEQEGFVKIEKVRDLGHNERCVFGFKPS